MTDYGDRGTFLGNRTWAEFDGETIILRVRGSDGLSIEKEIILDPEAIEGLLMAYDDHKAAHVQTG